MKDDAKMKSVIYDTDIGIDDAMALLFLHYAQSIDLKAITSGFGNASVENTTRNALAVKELFDIPAPVYRGAGEPMGARLGQGYPDHVHGADGLGEVSMPQPTGQTETQSAAEAIVDLVTQSPNEITIVAVGGLTNIALALALDASIANKIDDLIIMGGAFGYSGHRGNVSPVAEANIACDPLAADIVLKSSIPTTIVGLDVTHEIMMDQAFMDKLVERCGKAGQFVVDTHQYYLDFHYDISGKRECPLHDSSAVAYLLDPDLFTTIEKPTRVVTEGIALGQTIHGDDAREYVSDAWNNIPASTICTKVNGAAVLELYLTTLTTAI